MVRRYPAPSESTICITSTFCNGPEASRCISVSPPICGSVFGNIKHRHRNWKLVYYEAYLNEQDARDRELQMNDYGNARTYLKKRIKRCIAEGLEGAGRGVEPKSP